MRKIFVLFAFAFCFVRAYSQDFDTYLKSNNDNYIMPLISPQMSFQDYHLLSQNFRMQDMVAGVLVPGIVHFKAEDYLGGYSLVAVRSASYAGLAYEYLKFQNNATNIDTGFVHIIFNPGTQTYFTRTDAFITGMSVCGIIGSYLFDMIHGSYILHKRQAAIRYKYSFKASFTSNYMGNDIYGFNVGMKIYF